MTVFLTSINSWVVQFVTKLIQGISMIAFMIYDWVKIDGEQRGRGVNKCLLRNYLAGNPPRQKDLIAKTMFFKLFPMSFWVVLSKWAVCSPTPKSTKMKTHVEILEILLDSGLEALQWAHSPAIHWVLIHHLNMKHHECLLLVCSQCDHIYEKRSDE